VPTLAAGVSPVITPEKVRPSVSDDAAVGVTDVADVWSSTPESVSVGELVHPPLAVPKASTSAKNPNPEKLTVTVALEFTPLAAEGILHHSHGNPDAGLSSARSRDRRIGGLEPSSIVTSVIDVNAASNPNP
jgi:hypothetical protein